MENLTRDHLVEEADKARHEEIFCQVCYGLLTTPYEHDECGKLICATCLEKLLRAGDPCPYCKRVLHGHIHHSKRAQLYATNVKVKCHHEDCKAVFPVTKIQTHLRECLHEPRPCALCRVPVRGVDRHECPMTPCTCALCHEHYVLADTDSHRLQCPEAVINCPQDGCTVQLKNKDAEHHILNDCEYTVVTCPHCSAYSAPRRSYELAHDTSCDLRPVPCPVCRREVRVRHLPSHTADECVERPVRCRECSAELRAKDLPSHHQFRCPHRSVQCDWCSMLTKWLLLDAHKKEACACRPVRCAHCNTETKLRDLETHHKVCPECQVACPKCLAEMKRRELSAHTAVCPDEIVACPHRDWSGCDHLTERKSLTTHAADMNIHIQLAKNHVRDLTESQSAAIAIINDLEGKIAQQDEHGHGSPFFLIFPTREDTVLPVFPGDTTFRMTPEFLASVGGLTVHPQIQVAVPTPSSAPRHVTGHRHDPFAWMGRGW